MKQSSLFNLPKQEKKQEKKTTPKQTGLFKNLPKPTEEAAKTPEKKSTPKTSKPVTKAPPDDKGGYVPQVGDKVIIQLIDKFDAIIEYVDLPNLYRDHFYPIQTWVPKLNKMVRTTLKDCKLVKRAEPDAESPPWD